MKDEQEFLLNRFRDLAKKSYDNGIYTQSNFLTLAQQSMLLGKEKEFFYSGMRLYGGYEEAERKIAIFGRPEICGYEWTDSLVYLKIEADNKKFSEGFSHRDLLGAIMNLGIKRETMGDLIMSDLAGLLVTTEKIGDYIIENLYKVKHTIIKIEKMEHLEEVIKIEKEEISIQIPSPRCDAFVSKVWKMSRNQAQEMIRQQKILLNGMAVQNFDLQLKEGDVMTARGYGKCGILNSSGMTRKGNFVYLVQVYK